VQVWWRSGHLPARRNDLRKSLQTDRRTDGRTDDGRRAIALAHSWNELKKTTRTTFVAPGDPFPGLKSETYINGVPNPNDELSTDDAT